jgi:homoserine O-succinyltransferase
MFNHLEYDSTTLKEEYDRDVQTGGPITPPVDYFPNDDPSRPPENRWRSHGHLLYGNWINEIYQTTPYEIEAVGREGLIGLGVKGLRRFVRCGLHTEPVWKPYA